MLRLIALLVALTFAITTPVLAQPKSDPATKSDKAGASTKKAPLDINSASPDELKALPGIVPEFAMR
jgi:DNA uptake protein ComE-like DNA-binding protein